MDIQNNGKANAHYREIKEGLLDYPPPTNALTIQKSAMCRYIKKRNIIPMNRLVTRLMYLNNYLSFFPGSDVHKKIEEKTINEILPHAVPNSWYHQLYL